MQTRDELDNTLATEMLDLADKESSERIEKALSAPHAVKAVIANLPNKGDMFTINGLQYIVKFVDYKRGTVQARLYVPEKRF